MHDNGSLITRPWSCMPQHLHCAYCPHSPARSQCLYIHRPECWMQAANLLRKIHGIKVTGGKAPPPLASFADLGGVYKCSKRLLAKLEEHGWHEPTAIQRQAIPTLLKGRELFAVAPTGVLHMFSIDKSTFSAIIIYVTCHCHFLYITMGCPVCVFLSLTMLM